MVRIVVADANAASNKSKATKGAVRLSFGNRRALWENAAPQTYRSQTYRSAAAG
jgi:hypothetical protein